MANPEQYDRETIDKLLIGAGWQICDATQANIYGACGVTIRVFPPPGHGFSDYMLYVDGKACGVIEAKMEVTTFTENEQRISFLCETEAQMDANLLRAERLQQEIL